MSISVSNPQLTESQKKVFNSILEDIFYLESALKTTEHKNLAHLARISIIFNYISLETLRDFYCEKLSIKKDKKTGNYKWKSFFRYADHTKKIDLLLQSRQYADFKKIKDMDAFINKLRIQRNLILHRSFTPNKNRNQELQEYLKNIQHADIEEIFIKSKNCVEIMNYIMELN